MASDMYVDLGHLRLQSTSSALTLALYSSARVSSASPEASHPILADGDGKADHSTLESAWVCHGANMVLILDIAIPQQTTIVSFRLAVQERLTEALKASPLWTDLYLRPSLSTICPSLQHDNDRIVISLVRDDSQPIHSSLHQLGAGIPTTHIKPPPGIPCFSLDTVHLEVGIYGDPEDGNQSISTPPYSSTGIANFRRRQTTSARSPVDHVISLLDAALRFSTSKASGKLSQDVVISEVSSFKRLDEVFPVVWRPGYVAAVASRAVLVPTISHALSALATRTIRSTSLGAKMRILTQAHSPLRDMSEQGKQQHVVDLRLWSMLQRKLYVSSPSGRQSIPLLSAPSGNPPGLAASIHEFKGVLEPHNPQYLEGLSDCLSSRTVAVVAEDEMLDLETEQTEILFFRK